MALFISVCTSRSLCLSLVARIAFFLFSRDFRSLVGLHVYTDYYPFCYVVVPYMRFLSLTRRLCYVVVPYMRFLSLTRRLYF